MKGKLFLSGGGDEKQSFEVDRIFLEKVKQVLYVPAARRTETFPSCLEWFRNLLSLHKPVKIEMLTDLTSNTDLNQYDAVYVGGGNTYRLLRRIRESGFDKRLVDYYNHGGRVYGGSAGAIIWGRDINIASIGFDSDKNEDNLKETRGLDLLGGADIQCHYRVSQLAMHKKYATETGKPIIAIPEESAVLVEDGKLKVIGTKPVFLISSKSAKKFNPETEVTI